MARTQSTARTYTPAALAVEWQCSERHVRNLVARGKLRGFRLGGKLLRIPIEAVREFEQCELVIASESLTGASSLSSTRPPASDDVSGLTPKTRARLTVLRRKFRRVDAAQGPHRGGTLASLYDR